MRGNEVKVCAVVQSGPGALADDKEEVENEGKKGQLFVLPFHFFKEAWSPVNRRQRAGVAFAFSKWLTLFPIINFVSQDVKPNPTNQPCQQVK